jgi:uncharacterized protein (DUF736 family)
MQQIGVLEDDTLTVSIPFYEEVKFKLSDNEKKSAENHPDFLLTYRDMQFGSLWEKQSKKGNQMMSGNIIVVSHGIATKMQIIIMIEEAKLGKYKGKMYLSGGQNETKVSD